MHHCESAAQELRNTKKELLMQSLNANSHRKKGNSSKKKDKTRTYTVYLTVPRLDMEWHIQHMACNSSQISSTIILKS